MFECIDDAGVARGAVRRRGAAGCEAQGFDQMLGPVNFSTNYECGVLVEGFDAPPVVHDGVQPALLPGAATRPAASPRRRTCGRGSSSSSVPPPEKVARIAEKIRQREGIIVRPVNMKDFEAEVRRIKDIYNAAWEKNWGFVPMTEREFDHMARDMKQLVRAGAAADRRGEGRAGGLLHDAPGRQRRAQGGRRAAHHVRPAHRAA